MYLSLASLQQLPTDSVAALKTVRGAAQVAANSIWCSQCGSVAVENPNPPIETFQNTMLLGTILPIIANGYQRLLRIIDDETTAAEAAGQTKMFRFLDYGGLCGTQVRYWLFACAFLEFPALSPSLILSVYPKAVFKWCKVYQTNCWKRPQSSKL